MEKFKVWDTRAFTDLYGIVSQIEDTIVKLGTVSSLTELPPSLVPTANLFQLCIAYKLLYNKLLEKDLLDTGNSKQLNNSLH